MVPSCRAFNRPSIPCPAREQVVTTLGLGTWQLARYGWKVDVLKQRAQQLQEPPLDLSSGADDHLCVRGPLRVRARNPSPCSGLGRRCTIAHQPAP